MRKINFSLAEASLLAKSGIKAVILFGSQAQGLAHEGSDFDVGVIGSHRRETYDLVYDLVSQKAERPVNVDIVFLNEAPQELKNHVAAYGHVLYQNSPRVFADFREQVMTAAADFAPLKEIFSAATLDRVSL